MEKSYPMNLSLELNATDFKELVVDIKLAIGEYLSDNTSLWDYLDDKVKDDLIDQILCDIAKYLTKT